MNERKKFNSQALLSEAVPGDGVRAAPKEGARRPSYIQGFLKNTIWTIVALIFIYIKSIFDLQKSLPNVNAMFARILLW